MPSKIKIKLAKRQRRVAKIRRKIGGIAARPRLSIEKTAKHFRAQLIDDTKGHTLLWVSSSELKDPKITGIRQAERVGELLGQKIKQAGIKKLVLDRRGYKYHGRILKFAETLRSLGIDF